MNHTTQNTNSDFRHLTYSNAPDYSEMHLHHKLWNYFHEKQIENRLLSWTKAAKRDCFRQLLDWNLVGGNLVVQLSPFPEGYLPFSHIEKEALRCDELR